LKAIAACAGILLPYLSEIERGAKQPSRGELFGESNAPGTLVNCSEISDPTANGNRVVT